MEVDNSVQSPNFGEQVIPVEYAILHYTACSLQKTLQIFTDRERKVCAHFVIAEDGKVYDLGGFLTSGIYRQGAHAGLSRWQEGTKVLESFNRFSVGIEIVNLNGNVFPYPEEQIHALFDLLKALKRQCPALQRASRVLGHEQIAGFRGKCDPGRLFPWERLFREIYPTQKAPVRKPIMSTAVAKNFHDYLASISEVEKSSPDFWSALSSDLEKGLSNIV